MGRVSKADRAAIITRMHHEGATQAQMAHALGVSETTVWDDRKALGLKSARPRVNRAQVLMRWH